MGTPVSVTRLRSLLALLHRGSISLGLAESFLASDKSLSLSADSPSAVLRLPLLLLLLLLALVLPAF